MHKLTARQLQFLHDQVGLTATREQLEAVMNAPPGDIFSLEYKLIKSRWIIPPVVEKPGRGWKLGVRRSARDRLAKRTGRPKKAIKSS